MRKLALKWLKLNLLIAVVAVLALSCKHTTPFQEEHYFQALGKESNLVATADIKKLNSAYPGSLATGVPYVDNNAERMSIALFKDEYKEEDVYPAPFTELKYYGALEGDFSSFIGNTGLSWSKPFFKAKDTEVKYYTNTEGSLNLAFPQNGILLFASDSYPQAYEESIKNRQLYINTEDATSMASSVVSCYVQDPKTMIDLGFDLPLSVLLQMHKALVSVVEKEGVYYLEGKLEMRSEKLAKTMLTLLRNIEIQRLKKEGEKPNYAILGAMYLQDGAFIQIAPKQLANTEVKTFVDKLSIISGGVF